MICELCHKKKAEEAIAKSDEGEELYLCRDCARKENLRREKLRQETPNDSVVEIENGEGLPEDAPPIIRSIVEAVSDIFHDISNLAEKSETKAKISHAGRAPASAPAARRASPAAPKSSQGKGPSPTQLE